MSHYAAGRRAEYRAKRILELAGYEVTRAASSKGVADLIAYNAQGFRLVSVKRGTGRMTPLEREAFLSVPVPAGTTKEYWRFPEGCRQPIIEVLHS
jgi:Holliday junction resolvase